VDLFEKAIASFRAEELRSELDHARKVKIYTDRLILRTFSTLFPTTKKRDLPLYSIQDIYFNGSNMYTRHVLILEELPDILFYTAMDDITLMATSRNQFLIRNKYEIKSLADVGSLILNYPVSECSACKCTGEREQYFHGGKIITCPECDGRGCQGIIPSEYGGNDD